MKILKKIKKVILNKELRHRLYKMFQFKHMRQLQLYIDTIEHSKLEEENILFFSQYELDSVDLLWQACKAVMQTGKPKNLYLVVETKGNPDVYRNIKGDFGIVSQVSFIQKGSKEYYRQLATCKWMFSNASLGHILLKREGQVYEYHLRCDLEQLPLEELAEVQQNLLAADRCIEEGNTESIFYPETLLYPEKKKKNLLFYAGGLEKNGITTSLHSLLHNVDLEANTYYIVVELDKVKKAPHMLKQFPKQVRVLLLAPLQFTQREMIDKLMYDQLKKSSEPAKGRLKKAYKRNYQMNYPCDTIDRVIQFTGYVSDLIEMYSYAECETYIYVHNNMVKEIETKGYQNYDTLHRAYGRYDGVFSVTQDILEITRSINPKGEYRVVNNCFDYENVIEKARKEIVFDPDTQSTHTVEQIQTILQEDVDKFITIGRFSWEKGHDMLLDAFEQYSASGNNAYLFIIGGYGELYNKTLQKVQTMESKERIIIIKSMSNPMPILKRCDLFVLSSLYEGLGLTILEADTLKLPVVSTDIEGPRGFMKKYGGCLVEASREGILYGMNLYKKNEIPVMNVDYIAYNKQAIEEFYRGVRIG